MASVSDQFETLPKQASIVGLISGSRDCICIIMSRTGDLAVKKFFQYGSQGDSEIIGTLEVKEDFENLFALGLGLLSCDQMAHMIYTVYLNRAYE